ncbi:GIN domain-containing protein [Cellulomonas bogoriensis]|uniref:Putative auto-transporter adhesin head GIN domain-containing protein n=1 Tax=Cellulomonas bogoriensis 69B4 = DSM 16987 TaxID=1386082 RepID=A0A0A0BYK7_9CELL|nr:DUF2807 domain-containing protein [Cellulomonas bogoriensis]KGM13498.1 hypothetical protein N869_13630 [Cellulomonas bogoriensis 69B4 = DSM 16987]
MRSRPVLTVLAATVGVVGVVVVVAGCAADVGPRMTEQRDTPDARAVELMGSGSVRIEHGEVASLSVTAGERAMAHLVDEVHDGVLRLGVAPGRHRVGRVEWTVVLPELRAVSVRGSGDVLARGATGERLTVTVMGSGDVRVDDVDVQDVSVAIRGSGDVVLAGVTDRQQVSIEGSGDYRGADLSSATAVVTVRGSGDTWVHVVDELEVSVRGSGDVTHTGGAAVVQDVAGSGGVRGR